MKEQHDDKCIWLVTECSRSFYDPDPYFRFQICSSEEEARRVLDGFQANETRGREYRIERYLVGPDGELGVPLAQ
jgi:hypothetical protein